MRTRNQRSNYPTGRALPALMPALCGLGLLVLAGCGGGGGNNHPSVGNGVIVTRPTPMTYAGGTAKISVQVTAPAGIMASSVKVDVTDSAGLSLIGGPQVMSPSVNPANTYTYQVAVPNNLLGSVNKVYTVTVTATNTKGTSVLAPVTIGTVTVPFPPSPPPSPQ